MNRVRDPRVWISVATILAVLLGVAGVLLAVLTDWKFGLPTEDKVAVVNTVIAAVSCLLVAVAGVVALIAYLAASGRPDLGIEILFNFSFPNEPVFRMDGDEEASSGTRKVLNYKQAFASVKLTNDSDYAARNPGVRIELEGLSGLSPQQDWTSLQFVTTVGLTTIQWDGDIIHGRWSRTLPGLDFSDVHEIAPGAATLVATVAADGIRPITTRMPVRILSSDEYDVYTAERAARIDSEEKLTP